MANPRCIWTTKKRGHCFDVYATSCGVEYTEGWLTTNSFDNEEFSYCPFCGRRIEWGINDEETTA